MNGAHDRAIRAYRETVWCGPAAGLCIALAVMTVGIVDLGDKPDPFLAAYVGTYIAAGAAGLGALTGLFGGAVVYAVVRCAEPRLGARAVASLIPVVALGVSVPLAVIVASGTTMPPLVVAIDVVFTLA